MTIGSTNGTGLGTSEVARVVGLGASAGGLLALEQFFSRVPPLSGLAFVVVQHLDPTRKAMLTELLQRFSAIPVVEAADGMRLKPNVVFVIPPNAELTVAAGALRLAVPTNPRGFRSPIDRLFSSLARDQGERAIGVVLSGMGSDGSEGLQAIKSQGGLTLAQSPESAQFDSMPQSAIAAGCVDVVCMPADLPDSILRITAPADLHGVGGAGSAHDDELALKSVLRQLRERSKHDLSDYKPSTLRRRIERRQYVHGLASLDAYERFVRQNPQELDLLFKEMLIGVTSFFRDPAVWEELQQEVMPRLLARSVQDHPLRAWVVGCSTGEEAYSLAMVFKEVAAALPGAEKRSMQIFASDLNAEAVAVARRGYYGRNIATEMDPARLAKFFTPHGQGYLIDKQIREMVLFAQHDVILDPPFTRLDLLSCRNLMIYFNAALQRRLIGLFSYSLRPAGALLLGGAETIGATQSLFTPVHLKSRLFWRSDNPVHMGVVDFPVSPLPSVRPIAQESSVLPTPSVPANLQVHAEQALLREFAPAAVMTTAQGDIVYVNGSVGKYLEPASGKANWNLHVMAKPPIRTQISVAMRQALQGADSAQLSDLRLSEDPKDAALDVTIKLMQEPKSLAGLLMIVFRERALPTPVRGKRRKGAESGDLELAQDLQRCKDEIHALRLEMGAAAEELQAANEELQSTNEELQSANEELTTSKEESQSMNEELQTLNQELQSKLDDLALAHSDMQNLLNSTDIATLFLDNDLNVRRYTDQITRIVHLRDSDVGRPLTDLASTLNYATLGDDARQTLKTLTSTEKEITTTDGLWYMVRIKPYRTLANLIQGVVITLIDITAAKELEARLRQR